MSEHLRVQSHHKSVLTTTDCEQIFEEKSVNLKMRKAFLRRESFTANAADGIGEIIKISLLLAEQFM